MNEPTPIERTDAAETGAERMELKHAYELALIEAQQARNWRLYVLGVSEDVDNGGGK